jgi:hypothetical protein
LAAVRALVAATAARTLAGAARADALIMRAAPAAAHFIHFPTIVYLLRRSRATLAMGNRSRQCEARGAA